MAIKEAYTGNDLEKISFDLFKKTGNVGHYLLYTAIRDKNKHEKY